MGENQSSWPQLRGPGGLGVAQDKHAKVCGTKIKSSSELWLHYTIKLLKYQEVMVNFNDGEYIK